MLKAGKKLPAFLFACLLKSITFTYFMAKIKISVSLSETVVAKIIAIEELEKRGSFSNALESVIDFDKFDFIETTPEIDVLKSYTAVARQQYLRLPK